MRALLSTMTRRGEAGTRPAFVLLLVVTLLLAPWPRVGTNNDARESGACASSRVVSLLVEARGGKVMKSSAHEADPRSGHRSVGVADQTEDQTAEPEALPANFTDRLAHRMAEIEAEREAEREMHPSPWSRVSKLFKPKERKPCPPPPPRPVRYYSNGTDGDATEAPEMTLDDMEIEEAAYLDCKGGTSGWPSKAISKIKKIKPVKKVISWWSGKDLDDYSEPDRDPNELVGLGIGNDEKNMTAEEFEAVYAAEKERYRSEENHPLMQAAGRTYALTHAPPPAPPKHEKVPITLEDEAIIANVLKHSAMRNETEAMLEEAALRIADARARRSAGKVQVTSQKMTMIGVFMLAFAVYVYRARYGFGDAPPSKATVARLDHLRGTPGARMQQWGFNASGGKSGGNASGFSKGAPVFKPQFAKGWTGPAGTWSQNHGAKFKSAME